MIAPAAGGIVHLSKGVPVTDSLAIAREFGRRHGNVLQSLDDLVRDGTIGRLEFKSSSYLNDQGKKQRMIELTERGALIAMPFIGGRKSKAGQVRLVDEFISMRAELAAYQSGSWREARRVVSSSYKAMCDALKETRAECGKETLRHHYANEARMVTEIAFGVRSVDLDGLRESDLPLLESVEGRDAFLIARGRTFGERKQELQNFVAGLRAKMTAQIGGAPCR